MFLLVNGKAMFTPVKTGIAGDKYFEVLDGLKTGDAVITGPFASVRSLKDGDDVRTETTAGTAVDRKSMQQFFEAISIALQAIWSNKLRSSLTVVGNIVAVTSIIAVVSLVRGLNFAVNDAIQSQFAADSFSVQRRGLTRTDDEDQRAQSNPRITLTDANALRNYGATIGMVMAEADTNAPDQMGIPIARLGERPRRHQGMERSALDEHRARPHDHVHRVRQRA